MGSNAQFSGEHTRAVRKQTCLTSQNRQDLNSSVLIGSTRAFDHTTFPALDWERNPAASQSYILPPGFQKASQLLDPNLVEILKDVHGLQRIRDGDFFDKQDMVLLRTIDNHQASIQSRLMSLPAQSSISDSCRLGAYLCSTTLRCKLWHASVVPVSQVKGSLPSTTHSLLTVFLSAPSLTKIASQATRHNR